MQRLWIVLLLLGLAQAAFTNTTIDDTSPSIGYSGPTFHCPSAACPANLTAAQFNGTSTLTTGNITFSFTGSEIYVFFEVIGTAILFVDETLEKTVQTTLTDILSGGPNITTSVAIPLVDGPHTLVLAPGTGSIIELDHLIYTSSATSPHKSHTGAIVGGVIGGLILTAIFSIGVLIVRRREQRKRNGTRAWAGRFGGVVDTEGASEVPLGNLPAKS
ncbi:hypothetical protein B0H11DRAFT_2096756 [Mycena galericulata]|nr:hypothetical protein B0H11DRAFT_2096756 [Mycena galericulata]